MQKMQNVLEPDKKNKLKDQQKSFHEHFAPINEYFTVMLTCIKCLETVAASTAQNNATVPK